MTPCSSLLTPPPSLRPLPQVRNWYVESFKELRALRPIKDAEDEANFTKMLRSIYMRHAGVVPVSPPPFFLPPLRRPPPFHPPPSSNV